MYTVQSNGFTELIHTSLSNYLLLDKGRVVKTGKAMGIGVGLKIVKGIILLSLKIILKRFVLQIDERKKLTVEDYISIFGGGIY